MSCLDVMHHQSYGAHRYLPATSAAPAAAVYKAAWQHPQQQKKLCPYSKMDNSMDQSAQGKQPKQRAGEQEERVEEVEEAGGGGGGGDRAPGGKEALPAEAEYLSSRCVLFTYFQGDIGDVVDQHFSRALSQPSMFSGDPNSSPTPSGTLWRGGLLSAGQCGDFPSSFWSSGYPSQSSSCLSALHPDFSPSVAFNSLEQSTWAGHGIHQPGLVTPPPPSDPWPYGLGAQGYAHGHNVYPRIHPRHARHVVHHALGPGLDPRLSPLLLSSVCPPHSPVPHCEISKTEPVSCSGPGCGPIYSWPTPHQGSVDIFDSSE
ncbi:hypothetical protein AAFF_G00279430 [Aldrovandia affinis]|uniref:Transcription cofactor vestigial-like protein 3 n=1 Tax=Aldrovandia affinis TaxID=143900 RepID=A0AAD7WT42_9TELE|nr:hypothetical protein AAFF_G00279430 [Aldrovandia affinis]